MARRRSVSFVRPPARSTQWLGAGFVAAGIPTGSTAVLLATLNSEALALRPFTIVRTRLVLNIVSDQLVTSEMQQGVFSSQVVTEAAASAGIASLPTPLIEFDADYMVYQGWMNSFLDQTSVGFLEQGGSGNSWIIDSKAMRKVQSDDQVVFVSEGRQAAGYNISVEGRMLIKLH